MFTEIIQAEYKKQMLAMCKSLGIKNPTRITLDIVCSNCYYDIDWITLYSGDEEIKFPTDRSLDYDYFLWKIEESAYYGTYDSFYMYFHWWMRDLTDMELQAVSLLCKDIDLRD